MAVQIPDPGTGNGQTGDNEYVFRKKVKDNFSDQTNAASRLVGEAAGNVMPVGAFGIGGAMSRLTDPTSNSDTMVGMPKASGLYYFGPAVTTAYPAALNKFVIQSLFATTGAGFRLLATPYQSEFFLQASDSTGTAWQQPKAIYHTGNTTKDSNGFLKAASPIVKVFADKVELNDDAVNQNVTFKKNGIGDYTITTQSGLSTDGWYIELPKDMNGNPKVAVTLEETDGVISLKSYKRIFSMETFTFEPDLNEPLDIPDGRWIDLRLNEIPVEPSEPESEV